MTALHEAIDAALDDYVDDYVSIALDVFVAACIEHDLPVLDTHDRCVAYLTTYDESLPLDVFAAWGIACTASCVNPNDDVATINFAHMRDALELNPKSRIAADAYRL